MLGDVVGQEASGWCSLPTDPLLWESSLCPSSLEHLNSPFEQ